VKGRPHGTNGIGEAVALDLGARYGDLRLAPRPRTLRNRFCHLLHFNWGVDREAKDGTVSDGGYLELVVSIGRSCPFTVGCPSAKGQDPLSNRACGFPAHGLPVVSRSVALRSLRVLDGSAQTDEPEGIKEVRVPGLPLVGLQGAASALDAQ
jgi:hypothetical protein